MWCYLKSDLLLIYLFYEIIQNSGIILVNTYLVTDSDPIFKFWIDAVLSSFRRMQRIHINLYYWEKRYL